MQDWREKWHCGHNDHSTIDHSIAGITSDLVISPILCRALAKGKRIYLADQFLEVENDTKNPIVFADGSMSNIINGNHCTARGWITRVIFLPHMHRTTLKVRMSTEKVLSDFAQVLPCALEECWVARQPHWIFTPIYGITRTTVCYQSCESKKLTWWNKEQNILSSVDMIRQPNLYLKLKTIHKNIVESQQLLT